MDCRRLNGGNVTDSNNIEWDGVGEGFNVSWQGSRLKNTLIDDRCSGRLKRFMKLCPVGRIKGLTLSASERKNLKQKVDKDPTTPIKESKVCGSDELNDTFSEKVTLSTKSSSCDIKRNVARHVLTSLLSDEDDTMGPHQRNTFKYTNNDDNIAGQTFLTKSNGTECNAYNHSLRLLNSYDDTIFDGILEGTTPKVSTEHQNIFVTPTKENVTGGKKGKIDNFKMNYWPSMDMKTCIPNGFISVFQNKPEIQTISWQHKVVLSPLSY
jgi:hypothetical protein